MMNMYFKHFNFLKLLYYALRIIAIWVFWLGLLTFDYWSQPDEFPFLLSGYSFSCSTNLSFISKILNNNLHLTKTSLSCLCFLFTESKMWFCSTFYFIPLSLNVNYLFLCHILTQINCLIQWHNQDFF